jgi:hypothetical protein
MTTRFLFVVGNVSTPTLQLDNHNSELLFDYLSLSSRCDREGLCQY